MLKHGSYLVLGIGTDIGKTFLVENLCRILPQVIAIKPVSSGFSGLDKNSDAAKILKALGQKISTKNLNQIAPWRFEKAISPHLAGKVDFDGVKKFCRKKIAQAQKENKILLIEAAGGVMTPLTYKKTFLDLAKDLQLPILLVSANYLGSISHTLCALEVLKSHKVLVEKIILNEANSCSGISLKQMAKTLAGFSSSEIISMNKFLKNPLD